MSRRYVELMNGRYDRIRNVAWGEASVGFSYDGDEWTASIEVRPSPARDRLVAGHGPTLELALSDLEKELGLDRWDG